MKTLPLALTLALCPGLFLAGCNKSAPGAAEASQGSQSPRAVRSGLFGAMSVLYVRKGNAFIDKLLEKF